MNAPNHTRLSWLPRLVAESFVVILSVLFALAVDQWRDSRALEREVEQTRAAFADEIEGNKARLQDRFGIPYHRAMWEAYKRLSAAHYAGDSETARRVQNQINENYNTGIHPPLLRDAVWRSFAESESIREMEPAERFVLTDIYSEQENLRLWFRRMLEIWMEPHPYKNNREYQLDDINSTRMFLADVVAAEQRLLAGYDSALVRLRTR